MAAPKFAPVSPVDDSRVYGSPDIVPGSWKPDRPGELIGFQPEGARLGYQGPDQGFALKLANGFRDRLQLQPGEHVDDAIQGCLGIALRRASMFSRAPVVHDLTHRVHDLGLPRRSSAGRSGGVAAQAVRGRQQHAAPLRRGTGAGRHGARGDAADDARRRSPPRIPRRWKELLGAMTQTINLTDEQREFRAVVRQLRRGQDRAARRGDRRARPSTTGRRSRRCVAHGAHVAAVSRRSTAARARRSSTQAIAAEELAAGVRVDQPDVPHLQAGDAAGASTSAPTS